MISWAPRPSAVQRKIRPAYKDTTRAHQIQWLIVLIKCVLGKPSTLGILHPAILTQGSIVEPLEIFGTDTSNHHSAIKVEGFPKYDLRYVQLYFLYCTVLADTCSSGIWNGHWFPWFTFLPQISPCLLSHLTRTNHKVLTSKVPWQVQGGGQKKGGNAVNGTAA